MADCCRTRCSPFLPLTNGCCRPTHPTTLRRCPRSPHPTAESFSGRKVRSATNGTAARSAIPIYRTTIAIIATISSPREIRLQACSGSPKSVSTKPLPSWRRFRQWLSTKRTLIAGIAEGAACSTATTSVRTASFLIVLLSPRCRRTVPRLSKSGWEPLQKGRQVPSIFRSTVPSWARSA